MADRAFMDPHVASIIGQLTAEFELMPDVCGVLFFGSAQRGETSPHSDLDLYILTIGNEEWHEGRVVGGIPVELSFSPLRCMRDRVTRDNPTVIHAFASGTVMMRRGNDVLALVDEARRRWASGPPELSPESVLRWRFRLTDMLHDVLDLEPESIEARSIGGQLVPLAIEASCALHRRWPVIRKEFLASLRRDLPSLAPLVEAYYATTTVQDAIVVGTHVLGELGGPVLEYQTEPRPCKGDHHD